jgi:replicative DNA helicase
MTMATDTIPLRDLDAERGVIGRALYDDGRTFNEIAAVITADDFWLPEHAEFWRFLTRRAQRHDTLDLLAVLDALERFDPDLLAKLNGRAGVMRLTDLYFPGMAWDRYVEQMRHFAARRALHTAGQRILDLARDDRAVSELVADAQAAVSVLHASHAPTVSVADALVARFLSEYDDNVLPTGLPALDDALLGGLRPGYYVLAARTSEGKSALAITCLGHWLFDLNLSTLMASVEMDAVTVGVRLAAGRFKQNGQRMLYLKSDALVPREIEALTETTNALMAGRFALETRALKPSQIRARAHHLKRTVGLDVIVVDYLQRLQPDRRLQSRYMEVGEMSAVMKRMSEELNIPVIALAQLNRAAVGDALPKLEHLRESGDIEQDADVVWLLSRDGRDATLDIAKNRNGPLRRLALTFEPGSMRFEPRQEQPFG